MVTKKEILKDIKKLIDLQFKLNELNREYLNLLVDVTDEILELKEP